MAYIVIHMRIRKHTLYVAVGAFKRRYVSCLCLLYKYTENESRRRLVRGFAVEVLVSEPYMSSSLDWGPVYGPFCKGPYYLGDLKGDSFYESYLHARHVESRALRCCISPKHLKQPRGRGCSRTLLLKG